MTDKHLMDLAAREVDRVAIFLRDMPECPYLSVGHALRSPLPAHTWIFKSAGYLQALADMRGMSYQSLLAIFAG